jgi:predicted RNase H-like HicB family nuclease
MAKRSDPFTVIVEQDEEGYFFANVPELRGCHTQAKSLDVLMKRVAEAINLQKPNVRSEHYLDQR